MDRSLLRSLICSTAVSKAYQGELTNWRGDRLISRTRMANVPKIFGSCGLTISLSQRRRHCHHDIRRQGHSSTHTISIVFVHSAGCSMAWVSLFDRANNFLTMDIASPVHSSLRAGTKCLSIKLCQTQIITFRLCLAILSETFWNPPLHYTKAYYGRTHHARSSFGRGLARWVGPISPWYTNANLLSFPLNAAMALTPMETIQRLGKRQSTSGINPSEFPSACQSECTTTLNTISASISVYI